MNVWLTRTAICDNIFLLAPGTTAPNALATTICTFGCDFVGVGGKIGMVTI